MGQELSIENVAEYIQKICELNNTESACTPIQNDVLLFRGQSNKNYKLLPAIGRNRKFSAQCTIFNEERNLIEMAKYKMPDVFRNDFLPIELLALLQHHGIPTRLLDITENALVALFFACSGNEGLDGEVIVFKSDNFDVVNYPVVNAIADSYRFASYTSVFLSSFFAGVKNQPYFLEQMHNLKTFSNDDEGGKWIAKCCNKIMYIYAPVKSIRQQVQCGRYILFPNHIDDTKDDFCATIDEIPKDHPDVVARIIIPKDMKKQLLVDLSVLGITEEFLFCDNIDTVCKGVLNTFNRRYN